MDETKRMEEIAKQQIPKQITIFSISFHSFRHLASCVSFMLLCERDDDDGRRKEMTTIRFIVKYWKLSHEKLASVLGWALSFLQTAYETQTCWIDEFFLSFFSLFSTTCLNSIETPRKRVLSVWNQCRIHATREWTLGSSRLWLWSNLYE